MNGLALLGLFLILYGVLCAFIAIAKPPKMWEMGKIKAFRNKLGEKGTVVFFLVWGAIACGFGIWLLAR